MSKAKPAPKAAPKAKRDAKSNTKALPIAFSIITKSSGVMTKQLSLDASGKVVKDSSACALSDGRAERVEIATLAELPGRIARLQKSQAIVAGVAANGLAVNAITTAKRAAVGMNGAIARTRENFLWAANRRVLFVGDHDPNRYARAHFEEPAALVAQLAALDPQWAEVGYVRTFSTSSALYRNGKQVVAPRGFHLYAAADGGSIEAYSKALGMHAWAARLGYISISRSGARLPRTVIDLSIHQPERLLFEAGAHIAKGAGLTQRLPRPEYQPGKTLDLDAIRVTVRLQEKYERLVRQAKEDAAPEAARVREIYVQAEAEKLREATGMRIEDARRVVAERARGHLYADDLLHFDDHGWVSVADVLTEPQKYVGLTLADPCEPEYNGGGGIGRNVAVVMPGGKIYSQAHGGIHYTLHEGAPKVRVVLAGDLTADIAALDEAIGRPDSMIFERGDALVEPVSAASVPAPTMVRDRDAKMLYEFKTAERLMVATSAAFRFERDEADTDCPEELARQYLAIPGRRTARPIHGIAYAPYLRADGSVCASHGYDPATGIFMVLHGLQVAPLPAAIARGDVRQAKEILAEPFAEFPFVDEASRSVALSFMLSAMHRPILAAVPAHLFSSSAPGEGKGVLVDTCAIAVTGHTPAAMTLGEDGIEAEKRLAAALMEGDPVIKLDNLHHPLGGPLFASALTEPVSKLRILGKSERMRITNRQMIGVTGVVIQVLEDMRRRAIMCSIDAKMDKPETRSGFRIANLRAWARANRPQVIWALLVLARAHHEAGRPRLTTPLGSFEEWSERVNDVLAYHGYADPLATQATLEERDTALRERATVFGVLHQAFPQGFLARDVIQRLEAERYLAGEASGSLRGALEQCFGQGAFNTRVLGEWLHKHRNRMAGGLRLEGAEDSHAKVLRWRLVKAGG